MRVLMKKIVLILALFFLTSGSFASQNDVGKTDYVKRIMKFYGLPSSKNLIMLNVEGYQQTTDVTCGPSSVMSLMRYYHMLKSDEMNSKTELRIAKEMGTSDEIGTTPQQMVQWLKNHGFNVSSGEHGTLEMLRNNLKNGIPTIVEWIDWGGHWVVVTGYKFEDKIYKGNKDTLFLADPAVHFDNVKHIKGLAVFNPNRFASMWFDAKLFKPGHVVDGIYIIATPSKKTAH